MFSRFLYLKNKKYSCCIEYRLRSSFDTNQSIIRWQTAFVKEGSWVKAGDLLADINSSFQGLMAVGQNKLICYIPFDSLNFEDAIVANESVKTTDTFQTVHQETFDYELEQKKEFVISWKNLDWTQVKQDLSLISTIYLYINSSAIKKLLK